MPGYNVLDPSKYGSKVLLERFMRLALAADVPNWGDAYVEGLRTQELPLCQDALLRLNNLSTALGAHTNPICRTKEVCQSKDGLDFACVTLLCSRTTRLLLSLCNILTCTKKQCQAAAHALAWLHDSKPHEGDLSACAAQ